MDISFIILNYRSEYFLATCIESLKKHCADISYEIIIVNNDTKPVKTPFSQKNIRIIDNGSNIGFSAGCNIGAKKARGGYLFFLNPDTEFKEGNVLDLISLFSDSSVGIVSPQLILPSGDTQPWSSGCEITLWNIIKNNFGLTKSYAPWKQKKMVEVDWISGASLLIKKRLFNDLAGFDKNFFMYFEDVDLCKRARLLGHKIILLPSVKILHLGGQSSNNKKKQKQQYYNSQDYYFKKHFGATKLFLLRLMRALSFPYNK